MRGTVAKRLRGEAASRAHTLWVEDATFNPQRRLGAITVPVSLRNRALRQLEKTHTLRVVNKPSLHTIYKALKREYRRVSANQ